MALSEVSIGLISCCLPSIFNLLKLGLGRHFSNFLIKIGLSPRLVSTAGTHMDSPRNPADAPKDRGFVPLDDSGVAIDDSQERLYTGPRQARNYTTAYPVSQYLEHTQDPENAVPLHEIKVRDDFRVDIDKTGFDERLG